MTIGRLACHASDWLNGSGSQIGTSITEETKTISTQENFPQKENFVKCYWPTQIFRQKKILKLKIFNF
jgi:hypothetical protein